MSDTNEAKSNDVKPHTWTDGGESVLILRRINPDGTSTNAFRWPDGINVDVEAPDWEETPKCGNGLHGWPWGMGLGEGCDYDIITDRWLVIAVKPEDIVGELDGGWKCKFRFGTKLYDGVFAGAWAMVNSGRHRLMVKMAASGYYSKQAASGNYSTQAASGDYACCVQAADGGKVAVGSGGAFCLRWTDKDGRPRFVIGYEGEDGIKANTWYCVRDGRLVEVSE